MQEVVPGHETRDKPLNIVGISAKEVVQFRVPAPTRERCAAEVGLPLYSNLSLTYVIA